MSSFGKGYFFLILFVCFSSSSILGQMYNIEGRVIDDATGESILGVPIGIKEMPRRGVATDEAGKFQISLPEGNYVLNIQYVGYQDQNVRINLTGDMRQDIRLKQSSVNLDEVVVSAVRRDENVSSPQTGVERLSIQEVNLLPVLLGERDVLKAIQLLPGVKTASEGGTGFFVRGGTADQNLILIDDVPVYNASHLFGFFSTFNPDVVRDVTLYKGSMPAQYGERLSSVLDVKTRNGDTRDYHIGGGIGLISSKLAVEGPIQKGKSSFLLSGRRTYIDAVGKLAGVEQVKNSSLYFYDLNMKLNFILSDKDRLMFSGYWGKDKLALDKVVDTDWGNLVGTIKWSREIDSYWTSLSSLIFNRYSYNISLDLNTGLDISSVIQDYSFKQEFDYRPTANSAWKYGYQTTYHNISPGKYIYADDKGDRRVLKNRYSWENGLYATNTLGLSDRLEVIYGLRLSAFSALGKGDYYTLDDDYSVIDTISYKSGQFVKTYFNLEPRLSMSYRLTNTSSLKAAYARTTQSIHLLSNTSFGTPYDRWISSSNNVKPQLSDQFSLGYFRNFDNNMFEFSVETYYKDLRNQIDYKDNAKFDRNDDVESELRFGKGRAYGVEFMLRKNMGKLTGWLSYTLSKAEKKIDGINNNEWYDGTQDRTHDISIVAMYALNDRWSLSTSWVYYTGNAVSYPSGKYQIDGQLIPYFTERNGYRAPAYHRLDLGAVYVLKKTAKFYSELAFGLYNAYGRENAYIIQFRENDDDPTKASAYQYSLFKYIPSISWNFKF